MIRFCPIERQVCHAPFECRLGVSRSTLRHETVLVIAEVLAPRRLMVVPRWEILMVARMIQSLQSLDHHFPVILLSGSGGPLTLVLSMMALGNSLAVAVGKVTNQLRDCVYAMFSKGNSREDKIILIITQVPATMY
mmetsp:Transcript_3691/g.4757  ORF Transcript_3691/g.4757 Transcript_3691/m.4757 type:complete len:136 (-) Transcript_3691:8-415(-)